MGNKKTPIRLIHILPIDFKYNKKNITHNPNFEKLFLAARAGDINVIKKYFDHSIINCQNEFGATILMQAGIQGHINIVKFLCDNGADIEIETLNKNTALMRAAHYGQFEVVKFLLEKGANVHHINDKNFDVLDIVEQNIALHTIPNSGILGTYELIRQELLKYYSTVDLSKKNKDFQDIRNINSLTLIKLLEIYEKNKFNDFNEKFIDYLISKIKLFIATNYNNFILNSYNELLSTKRNEIKKYEDELLKYKNGSIIEVPFSSEEIDNSIKGYLLNKEIQISYVDFARSINLLINLFNHKLHLLIKTISSSTNYTESIDRLNFIRNEIGFLISNYFSSNIVINFKTDIMFEQLKSNLLLFDKICYNKSIEVENFFIYKNKILENFDIDDSNIQSNNEKALLLSKILDNYNSSVIDILNEIFNSFNKEIDKTYISKIYESLQKSYTALPKDFLGLLCKIQLEIKIKNQIAPKEIIINISNFTEHLLYKFFYLNFKNYFTIDIKKYYSNLKLNYRSDNDLTIGFFLFWFNKDFNNIKKYFFENSITDDILMTFISCLNEVNRIRKSIAHFEKNPHYALPDENYLVENSNEIYNYLINILSIFQDYYKKKLISVNK